MKKKGSELNSYLNDFVQVEIILEEFIKNVLIWLKLFNRSEKKEKIK